MCFRVCLCESLVLSESLGRFHQVRICFDTLCFSRHLGVSLLAIAVRWKSLHLPTRNHTSIRITDWLRSAASNELSTLLVLSYSPVSQPEGQPEGQPISDHPNLIIRISFVDSMGLLDIALFISPGWVQTSLKCRPVHFLHPHRTPRNWLTPQHPPTHLTRSSKVISMLFGRNA